MIFVTVSTGHFDPLFKICNQMKNQFEFFGQIGSGVFEPHFSFVRTCSPEEIELKMTEAKLVISHAGTGMLSRLYYLKKPLIICPKQVRYGESNDGQIELAKKWAELGMGILCMEVENLETAIHQAFKTQFVFPRFDSLGSHLSKQLGGALRQEPISLVG